MIATENLANGRPGEDFGYKLEVEPVKRQGEAYLEPLDFFIKVNGVRVAQLVPVYRERRTYFVKIMTEYVYRQHFDVQIQEIAPEMYQIENSTYWYPQNLRQAIAWVLDNYSRATQPEEIDRLDRADRDREAEAAFRKALGDVRKRRHYTIFRNQADRPATLLATLLDEPRRAFQLLYEYEMPNGTTALFFEEYGDSPLFQKAPPHYYTLTNLWLETLVEAEEHWEGRSQSTSAIVPQPEELLHVRKVLGRSASPSEIRKYAAFVREQKQKALSL